jgi:MFS family permease
MAFSLNPDEPQTILRHRPFALFWFARVATMVAFQMQAVAVGWQIYALTGSALYLGLVGLAQFLPMFLLTLAVGHVADRYDRRTIARICQIVEGFAAFALAWGSALAGRARRRSSSSCSSSVPYTPSKGRPCSRSCPAW